MRVNVGYLAGSLAAILLAACVTGSADPAPGSFAPGFSAPAHSEATAGAALDFFGEYGYGALDLRDAYGLEGLPSTTDKVVGIISAGAYPQLGDDLHHYRTHFGLAPCRVESGCLTVVDVHGGQPLTASEDSFGREVEERLAAETAMDVDMVSAGCPECRIVVALLPWQVAVAFTQEEEDAASEAFLEAAETLASLGADSISISYGFTTTSGNSSQDVEDKLSHLGPTIFASAGDSAFSVGPGLWPQSLPGVVSVGGTTLSRSASERGWDEVAWAGSSVSCGEAPSMASDPLEARADACTARFAGADISAAADPLVGIAAYNTYHPSSGSSGGFFKSGGTSASAPLASSILTSAGALDALVDLGDAPGIPGVRFNDITLGSVANTDACLAAGAPANLCTATAGYDGLTGLGSPYGNTSH